MRVSLCHFFSDTRTAVKKVEGELVPVFDFSERVFLSSYAPIPERPVCLKIRKQKGGK